MVAGLCLVNLFANSAYSSIAPFFPAEAVAKGVAAEYIGFIFSGYSVSMCLVSPILGKFMDRFGRKPVLLAGCFCEVRLNYANFIGNRNVGVRTYRLCRESTVVRRTRISLPICRRAWKRVPQLLLYVFSYLLSSLNIAMAIIATKFPDRMTSLISLLQTFTGLGMLCGPIFGSILYSWGGF